MHDDADIPVREMTTPVLEVSGLTVRFGGVVALDDISLAIGQRTICGLIGPNGAGKTTLFNVISRVYEPASGSVRCAGTELLDVPAHRIAALGIARTFQNLALFPSLTVEENVMVGAHSRGSTGFLRAVLRLGVAGEERALRARAAEVLGRLGLHHLRGERVSELPYGTLKRVEIARALAPEPSLVLLDEPASGLTHSEMEELGLVIASIRDEFGAAVLLVEHRMPLVMGVSDHVVVLAGGSVIAQGSPAEVQRNPEVLRSYLAGSGGVL